MPSDRKLSGFVHDLELYCRIAEILRSRPASSLRDIAERLGISSVSIVSTCIRRMEEEYGKTLVSITSTSGYNNLTHEGLRVLQIGKKVIDELQSARMDKPKTTLRVAASHLLLTYVLPEFVREYLRSPEGRGKNIEFNDACKYDDTLHLVNSGAVDFALTWDFEGRGRQAESYEFLNYEKFDYNFETVLICHPDHEFAHKHRNQKFVRIEDLARERVFVLRGHHQPFREILPSPNRVELEDYSTIISNVTMGLEGVALVPGVYRALDYYQKLGTLIHIPIYYGDDPLITRIAGIYKIEKKGGTESVMNIDALNLYKKIKDHYNNRDNELEPGWRTPERTPAFLTDVPDLAKYGQAYFMAFTSPGKVEWQNARIHWERTGGSKSRGKLTLANPLVDTGLCESYTLTAGSLSSDVHYLVAEPKGRRNDDHKIVATFHMKFTVPTPGGGGEEEAIYGHWYGSDNGLAFGSETCEKPMIGQFILVARGPDDEKLLHRTIARITRLGMLRLQTNHVDRPPSNEGSESTPAR
jgi:DNA-binding transcriptional LysR family regulator